jgi:hypothetical protein
MFPVEQFRKNGISYEPSPDPKGGLYLGLLPLLNSGKVRLLNNKRLVSQLLGLERNTARGGKDSIDHARGGHDDVANAAAGALVLALVKKGFMRVGTYCPTVIGNGDGRIHWHDQEPEPLRVRYITVQPDGHETEEVRLLPRDPRFIQGGA